ncbi:hypothetical protein A1D22_05830 [Pasteurellaceae bacterium LFhippo2]|nr:hypothetical protein [Pasteurellaceae bacterium LFhippo2]
MAIEIEILHKKDLGNGLVETDGKFHVKPDNTGNVQFTVSEQGLKGDVTLPAAFDPSALQAEIQALKTQNAELVAKNQAQDTEIQSLKAREDIKLQGAELDDATNELKLTLSDGVEVKTSLAKFVDAPKTAQQYWTEIQALPNFANDLIKLLTQDGVIVKDLGGTDTTGVMLPYIQ